MVEVEHEPRRSEPHTLGWGVLERLSCWTVGWAARNGVRPDDDVYRSIDEGRPYTDAPGVLRAHLLRR